MMKLKVLVVLSTLLTMVLAQVDPGNGSFRCFPCARSEWWVLRFAVYNKVNALLRPSYSPCAYMNIYDTCTSAIVLRRLRMRHFPFHISNFSNFLLLWHYHVSQLLVQNEYVNPSHWYWLDDLWKDSEPCQRQWLQSLPVRIGSSQDVGHFRPVRM